MKPKHYAYIWDKRGRLLAVGENQYDRTHPVQHRYARRSGEPNRVYLHAEVAALIKALKRGKPYRILVVRHYADGTPAPSKPCPACTLALKEAGVRWVEFSDGKGYSQYALRNPQR